jgi:hypothetical protein
MKKIFHVSLMLLATIFLFSGCRKMDTNYKDYVVPGGLVYPGKALATTHSGQSRVEIVWPKGVDRSVVKAKIYWNNFADSVVVDIASITTDSVKVMINNLEEKNYTFVIRTYDAQGNKSVPV